MSYLSEIKKSLTKISNKHGLKGVSVELAIDLLSQALYYNKVDNVSLINKNSVDTTNNMSTIIQYALTNLYPIYRGKNAVIRIRGFWKDNNVVLHRGDKVFSSKQFNLYVINTTAPALNGSDIILGDLDYYNGEFSLEESTTGQITTYVPVEIDLLVAKNFIDDTKFNLKNQAFYVESDVTEEISEDVEVKREINGVRSTMNYTKLAEEHIDRMNMYVNGNNQELVQAVPNPLALLLTSYNFGIRLYPGEIVPKTIITTGGEELTINKLSTISSEIDYYFNYFPYYEYNPTYNEVKNISIDGFQIIRVDGPDGPDGEIGKQSDFNQYGINMFPYTSRESINDDTAYKVKINLVEMQKTRSVYDISDTFNKMFETKIINSSVTFNYTTGVYISYIPKSPDIVISDQEWKNFVATKLYFLPTMQMGHGPAPKCEVNFSIVVKSQVYVSNDEINAVLSQYNYLTNCTITYQEIFSKLSKIPAVSSIILTVWRQYSSQEEPDEINPQRGDAETQIVNKDDLGTDYINVTYTYNNQLIDEVTVSR